MDSKIINKIFLILIIFVPTQLNAIEFKGKFLQGHYIIGSTDPSAQIIIGKKQVKVSKDGYFVFGIDRDRKFDLIITKIKGSKKEKIIKKVLKRKYNIQRIDGLEGLTKGMSIDLAKYNIRVNTVCPTFVVTPMTRKFLKSKKFKKEVLGNIPLGKFAELSDVASAAVFLASDAASMITGTSLLVDGGWTAK